MQDSELAADSMISSHFEPERKTIPGLVIEQKPADNQVMTEENEAEEIQTEAAKKKNVVRIEEWNEKYKVISIENPIEVNKPNEGLRERLLMKKEKKIKKEKVETEEKKEKESIKERFSMEFEYLDDKGEKRSKTIYFGSTKTLYRIDGISGDEAQIINNRITKNVNPFVREYWIIMLLNGGPIFYDNVEEYRRLILENNPLEK